MQSRQAPETSTLGAWVKTFRDGLAPELTLDDLKVLAKGLREDDPRLIQGATCTPPPLYCCADWDVEGGCLIGYVGWQSRGCKTVSELEEFFAATCFAIDQHLNEPAACRWLLNWYDDAPREEVRKGLLEEVEREIRLREGQ